MERPAAKSRLANAQTRFDPVPWNNFLWNWDQIKKLAANRDFAFGSSPSTTPKRSKNTKKPERIGLGRGLKK
ncbi:hypothetical protein [Paenibacillus tyrfis]|uniref:hypothetical protein n=1 Tax=Paenibacillus tyrfis TaxID=1501230 RepID=UPI00248FC653|nr:hypothetical protein [Paenibacillus tyrfis]